MIGTAWRWLRREEKLLDAEGKAEAYLGFIRDCDADRTRLAGDLLEAKVAVREAHRAIAWLVMQAGGTARIQPTTIRENLQGAGFESWADPLTDELVIRLLRPVPDAATEPAHEWRPVDS